MAKDSTNYLQFSGPYMIQDNDHLGTPSQSAGKAVRGNARQADQSNAGSRQQTSGKSRGGQRQAH